MNIATFFKASIQTVSKESFKRQHPSPYLYLTIRNGFYHLYTSQEPSFALAEAWLKKINSSEWGLIEPLDNNQFFFMFVGKGDIIKAYVGSFEQLDSVLLERCKVLYIVDSNQLASSLESSQHQALLKYHVEPLSPLTPPELAPFALKKHKKIPIKAISLLALLTILGIAGSYAYREATKPEPLPPPVDPYLAYRTTVNQSFFAPEILHNALSLGAIGSGLPYGWQFKTVSLQGDAINLTAERTSNGQRTVIMSWLKQHPQLLPYSQVSLDSLSITLPLLQTLQKWHNKIMPTEPSLSSVIDTQVALGWQMTELTTDNGLVSTTSHWTATKETALSELASFSQMVSQLPVTITKLDITPSGAVGYFKIQIRFAFMGQK